MFKIKILIAIIGFMMAVSASVLVADTVETRDGARLVGKITGITDKKITLDTTYAGALEINRAEGRGGRLQHRRARICPPGKRDHHFRQNFPHGPVEIEYCCIER